MVMMTAAAQRDRAMVCQTTPPIMAWAVVAMASLWGLSSGSIQDISGHDTRQRHAPT